MASGKELLAALVIDTSGGRSQAVINFIQDKSGEKVETINYDVGLNYYTRFFKMPERVSTYLHCTASKKNYILLC